MREVIDFVDRFRIADKQVGRSCPCFVIAEAGVAHFGKFEKAVALVDLAKDAGADAVKFQIFDIDRLIASSDDQWRRRMASRCLPYHDFEKIKAYCDEVGIIFLATAHEEAALDFLLSIDVPAFKIGSGELHNWSFIRRVCELRKPVILSTGMYTLGDVDDVVSEVKRSGNAYLALLHCVTSYPTPPRDVNLNVMPMFRKRFDCIVGYSDHTAGSHISLAAVSLGAAIIEKHISLDFGIPDAQDWKVSCGVDNFPEFIEQIREVETALGHDRKKRNALEEKNMDWARKSLVLVRDIVAGELIGENVLSAKRPGTGISPKDIDQVVGKRSTRDLSKDWILSWEDFS